MRSANELKKEVETVLVQSGISEKDILKANFYSHDMASAIQAHDSDLKVFVCLDFVEPNGFVGGGSHSYQYQFSIHLMTPNFTGLDRSMDLAIDVIKALGSSVFGMNSIQASARPADYEVAGYEASVVEFSLIESYTPVEQAVYPFNHAEVSF